MDGLLKAQELEVAMLVRVSRTHAISDCDDDLQRKHSDWLLEEAVAKRLNTASVQWHAWRAAPPQVDPQKVRAANKHACRLHCLVERFVVKAATCEPSLIPSGGLFVMPVKTGQLAIAL